MRDGNEGGGVGAGWLATSSLLLLGGRVGVKMIHARVVDIRNNLRNC
jgi:hypothetical protein